MAGSLSLLHHKLSCQGLVFNLIIKETVQKLQFLDSFLRFRCDVAIKTVHPCTVLIFKFSCENLLLLKPPPSLAVLIVITV